MSPLMTSKVWLAWTLLGFERPVEGATAAATTLVTFWPPVKSIMI